MGAIMYEELYAPLPDVDAYLERICIGGARKPSAEFLDELVHAHQLAVPFENLDVYDKRLVPSLARADLFDKIVTRKRGGYCFELNALFHALLEALGFDAYPVMVRVTLRPYKYPTVSHRASIVRIDGRRYVADVGFGGPAPSFALLVEDGFSRTECGQTFTMRDLGDSWWDIRFTGSSGEEKSVLQPCMAPLGEQDFEILSHYQALSEKVAFTQNRIVNIRTARGSRNLRNLTYTEHVQGEKLVRDIDESEIDSLLDSKFGIRNWR